MMKIETWNATQIVPIHSSKYFPIVKMYQPSWYNKLLSFTFKFGKHNIFSKFRICVGKFQIEKGPHRKIQREGRVCINNIY
jgi:hypothetical protein